MLCSRWTRLEPGSQIEVGRDGNQKVMRVTPRKRGLRNAPWLQRLWARRGGVCFVQGEQSGALQSDLAQSDWAATFQLGSNRFLLQRIPSNIVARMISGPLQASIEVSTKNSNPALLGFHR